MFEALVHVYVRTIPLPRANVHLACTNSPPPLLPKLKIQKLVFHLRQHTTICAPVETPHTGGGSMAKLCIPGLEFGRPVRYLCICVYPRDVESVRTAVHAPVSLRARERLADHLAQGAASHSRILPLGTL